MTVLLSFIINFAIDDESGSGSGQDADGKPVKLHDHFSVHVLIYSTCFFFLLVPVVETVEYLDKFELGMSNDNVSPVCLQRRLDGISKPIYVRNGFPLGDSVHNRAYVS